jgi:hypothetical protein
LTNRLLNVLLFVSLGYVLSAAFGFRVVSARNTLPREVGLKETIAVLERGENALTSSSADHRQALKNVLDALPSGAPDFVRSDLMTFLKRMPDKGAHFECGPEFMRYRARQELERVRDKLLNTNPQPAEPQFCYAVPFAIDLAQPIKSLEIYGYDLDTQPLELFVVNNDGSFEDLSFALSTPTHYHLTVDLERSRARFSARSQMLGIAWGHLIRYSVSLIRPGTALCLSQIEEISAGKAITFSPLRISGNGRLGRGGNVRASAMLNYDSNKVDATVCMTATDQEPNPAAFGGCGVEYVYTTDPERTIEGIFGGLESRTPQIHSSRGQNIRREGRAGPVSQWVFVIPGAQSEAGVEPAVTVVLGKIRIASTRVGDCLPAVAYLEARRKRSIAPETIKRLDSESRTLPREIFQLRPRFAPPN